jgi:hypothetical protein
MNTLYLAQRKVKLKKASGTNGGEWQGPCPGCGGADRFHVWPAENEGRGGYWCRGCGKTGDNIQFLRDFEGMSFRDACAELNIDLPDRSADGYSRPDPPPQYSKPVFTPAAHPEPADLWQEKAEKFVSWAQLGLAGNPEQLAWLAARGIDAQTAKNFRLGWNAGEKEKDLYRPRQSWGLPEVFKEDGKPKMFTIPRGLVIPYIVDGVIYRIRIRRPQAHRTPEWPTPYHILPGSAMSTMIIGRERRAFVIIESELDAIAVSVATDLAGAVALGSVAAKPDAEAFAILKGSLSILNALDYGDIGGGAKAAERAMAWWKEQFSQCDRWPVPKGKDPGEAHQMGIDLMGWIKAGLPPALTIIEESYRPRPQPDSSPAVIPNECEESSRFIAPLEMTDRDPARPEPVEGSPPLPKDVMELWQLLRKNTGVKIINTPDRYTVLRDGKYVGGRINELVFRSPDVLAYIDKHPASEIDGLNLINKGDL